MTVLLASPSLPPPHCSLGDQDLSALASRQATKEGGLGGGTKVVVVMQISEARVTGTGSHVPPLAPAAPGFPTVANQLNYFLISTR